MEKKVLEYQGNLKKLNQKVLTFDEFIENKNRTNERMEVEIMAPDDVVINHDYSDVMNIVGSKIEQICGWDFSVLMKYIGDEYQIEFVNEEDLVMWVHQQVQDCFKPDTEIRGEVGAIKQGKESEFAIALEQLDFGMCVEKLIRKLKGLEENDEKYPPNYFKKMADLMDEYIRSDKE